MAQHPNLIFGASFLGVSFPTTAETEELLNFLFSKSIIRIDTARRYPAVKPGESETLLGRARAATKGFVIDTKVQATAPGVDPAQVAIVGGRGSLTKLAIRSSVKESFEALGVGKVHLLQCHTPDVQTPLEETAAAFDEVFREGKFEKLGICNYSVDQVAEFITICTKHGYVRPMVYQGQYNALFREPENGLLSFLKKEGIAFNAYSPLAGGFLTGKVALGHDITGTRFEPNNKMGAWHRDLYDKAVMHDAVKNLQKGIEPLGLTLPEVSLRWLAYHSALGQNDGIIFGASKTAQLESNLKDLAKGPLEQEVVEMMEETWVAVKG